MVASPTGAPMPGGTGVGAGERGSRIALAGIVFSVLFVLGWFLLRDSPSLTSPSQELIDYYGDPSQSRSSLIAGLYVVPFAAIAFIWFMAALRDRYVRTSTRENTLLSTVHLVAGALVVASLFIVAAVELALVWLADVQDPLDVDSARAILALGQATSDIMALRVAAVFIAVSATRAVRSGLFPRLYGVASMAVTLTLLFVYDALPEVTLLVPAWVAASSVLILVRRRTHELPDGA